MKSAFVIRFHYSEGDPHFDWRLGYFRSVVLPRILAQSDQSFDIAIWCNPWHEAQLLSLSEKIRTFRVRPEVDGYIRPEDRARAHKYHIDFTYWKDVVGLPQYDLQMGLDNDDLIGVEYVSRLKEEIDRQGSKSLHVCFQPFCFNLPNLTQYGCRVRYTTELGSPFFGLYQEDKSHFIFAYEDSHLKLPKMLQRSVLVPEGYCWFTIHGGNSANSLAITATPILNP